MDTNQLKNLIRVGKVSSVNGKTCRARVTFPDKDDLVSDELAVLQIGANGTEGYWVPEVNTQVLCLFLPNASGNGLNAGFILGAYYSKAKPPPEENADVGWRHYYHQGRECHQDRSPAGRYQLRRSYAGCTQTRR